MCGAKCFLVSQLVSAKGLFSFLIKFSQMLGDGTYFLEVHRIPRTKSWNSLSLENVTVLVCSCRGLTVKPVLSGELSGAGTSVTSAFSSWKPGDPCCHAESVGKRCRHSGKKRAEITEQGRDNRAERSPTYHTAAVSLPVGPAHQRRHET